MLSFNRYPANTHSALIALAIFFWRSRVFLPICLLEDPKIFEPAFEYRFPGPGP